MSLFTDPVVKSGFPQNWTVFYWCWWVVWPLLVLIGFLGSATLFQGCALVMASMCTKELPQGQEPAKWHKLLWALVLGLVGVALRILGGLKALQLSAVIFGIPTVFVMVMVLYSFLKWAKEDFKDQFEADEFVLAQPQE